MPQSRSQSSSNRPASDEVYLQKALALAASIPQRPWPNPPVGALVVKDGEVVGRGAHHGAGKMHAERAALSEAGARARGATLYCTLEPCRHHGRTPPCTDAILAAGISRVVAGVKDLNPPASGGLEQLRAAGLEVALGVLAEPCLDLIWPFVASERFKRPYVELKTATSLDGRFSGPAEQRGRPSYLTGGQALEDVHRRRRWADLVLVGAGTARQDHPRLDTRLVSEQAACPRSEPLAGCVSGFARRPGVTGSDLALDRATWFCFFPEGHPPALPEGAEPICCPGGPDGVDPAGLAAVCSERDLHAIFLEGGPRLAASFLKAGLVDRWVLYTAPVVLGGGSAWPEFIGAADPRFHLTRCEPIGADLCSVWDRRDFAVELARATDTCATEGGC